MNIKQAKDYIKHSIQLYLKKDEFGDYRIPVVRQRPIFLLGAPGIGKTAIMEQIAQELGIALVSYSMTHHTRQSALGLPFITQKNYGGEEVNVSEYTMSEIIASIYDTMKESGLKEGVLFLDEINCVSETLAPSMLQFLQYKVFGRHQVPEGWVIVTAGNPPEYNKSVREFDVVTMDRLKVLEVEADLNTWKEYASNQRVHGAILNYLELKKEHFYVMEMTAKGRCFVTARGWEDLSGILYLYEEENLPVEESLVGQYIHNDQVVKEFTAYYDLYNKYKRDYNVSAILEGGNYEEAAKRANNAPFDERLSLLGMLLDRVQSDMKDVMDTTDFLTDLKAPLSSILPKAADIDAKEAITLLENQQKGRQNLLQSLKAAGSLAADEQKKQKRVIRFLEETQKEIMLSQENWDQVVRGKYNALLTALKQDTQKTKERLHALFGFVEAAFAGGNEMLILVTELTTGKASALFLAAFGSEDYTKYNQELMLSERAADLTAEIIELEI